MQSEQVKYADPWRVTEYADVAARARELGCRVPTGIALLPGNFVTAGSVAEFRFHEVVPEVRSAWQRVGLKDTGPGRKWLQTRAVTSEAPSHRVPLVVFLGSEVAGDSKAVLLALGLAGSVLGVNPSSARAREVRLDVIIERPGGNGYACLEYRGHACELAALAKEVRGVWAGQCD